MIDLLTKGLRLAASTMVNFATNSRLNDRPANKGIETHFLPGPAAGEVLSLNDRPANKGIET